MAFETKDRRLSNTSRMSMTSAYSDGETRKTLNSLRRLSSTSVKMGLLMTSQESLENNAAAEFKQLNISSATPSFPTTVGSSEAVSSKNRWNDHVPYDHNRVVLTNIDDSRVISEDRDYINASFIRGCSSNGGYIATQGPLPGTFEDFWRMVWSQNSRLIVMMSRTVEGYQTRSYKYWPEPSESLDLDVLLVSTEWEYEKATHVERKIVVKHEKSGETRTVHQLQFLAWPEDSDSLPCVPSFVAFWKAFRKLHSNDHGPPVVHCSNGTRRTSLLLAMDILYTQQQDAETVDAFGIVLRLREDRAYAVLTLEHYIYLHYALIEACTSTSQSHNKEEDQTNDRGGERRNSTASSSGSSSVGSPDSTFGKIRQFFKGDSQDDALSKIDESDSVYEEENNGIGSFIVSPFRQNAVKKRNSKCFEQQQVESILLGKSIADIEDEYKIFSSQTSTEPPPTSSPDVSCIATAIGPSSSVHTMALGRKPNFRRCESQISIPVENGNVPVTCIPLNHPFLRRMSTQKHNRLRHSASLQDSHIISDVTGVLPRQFKKSFLATVHTKVTSLDFWQVMYDTGSSLIVRVIETEVVDISSELNAIETPNFKLSVVGEKDLTNNITQTKLTLTPQIEGSFDEEDTKERVIKMLTVRGVPDEQEVIPIPVLLRLFYSVDRWLSRTSTSLVNVHCSAGMSVVGFVCAAYNAVSNLKVKDEADVYIAARIVQDSIPVAISKIQYTQLYSLCDLYKKQQRGMAFRHLSSVDSQSSIEETATP